METLEVGDLGLVSRLHEGIEAGPDQLGEAAAEDDLLAEEVGLGLLAEGRLDDAAAGAADALGIGEADLLGAPGGVLLDGEQTRHAAPLGVHAPHEMAGSLGGDHEDIDVGRRHDLPEVDVEAVGEGDGVSGLQLRADIGLVDAALHLVVDQDHDDVAGARGLGHGGNLESRPLGLGPPGAALAEADDDADAALLQVEGVGVSLTAVTDDGDRPVAQQLEVGVVVVEHLHRYAPCPGKGRRRLPPCGVTGVGTTPSPPVKSLQRLRPASSIEVVEKGSGGAYSIGPARKRPGIGRPSGMSGRERRERRARGVGWRRGLGALDAMLMGKAGTGIWWKDSTTNLSKNSKARNIEGPRKDVKNCG